MTETARRSMMSRVRGMMFKLPYMISCVEFEDFIDSYLDDDLPPRQRRIFEMHLALCAECRAYLRKYKASIELAKSAEAEPVDVKVPEDLVRAVLAAREGGDT